jgi:hypothetical protein
MSTKRRPISRKRTPPTFPPVVLAAFRRMQSVRCTCPPIDWVTPGAYFKRPPRCAGCDAWWADHSVLHRALKLPPWQWPAFEEPDAACPYPAGCFAAGQWHRRRAEHPERFELHAALKVAADLAAT